MKIVTLLVSPDEPCWGLIEGPRKVQTPDGAIQNHWVQRVYVIRGDAIAEYSRDLGLALNYAEVPPLIIPSFGDDTVAQLQEMAERHRHDDKWIKRRKVMLAESTMLKDVVRQMEQDREWAAMRSVFGPGISVQRNISLPRRR